MDNNNNHSHIGRNNPYRPMNRSTPSSANRPTAATSSSQIPKRYVLTPPKQLRPYFESKPEIGYPDFFPWTGHQLEDVLNARTIRNGFQEPPLFTTWQVQPSPQGLCTMLKQPDAVNALSSFLNAAYHKRSQLGRLPANTTFKPLPRVTLTEQKREAWLRDLANIHVPLKKLSRTIPHGIKDRSLIDQCCMKNIPIHRAVWLSRCVGANELRSLRRKGGTGGGSTSTGNAFSFTTTDLENRWVKAWTLQIASYIEDTIDEARPASGADDSSATTTTTNNNNNNNNNNNTLKPSAIRQRQASTSTEWYRKLNYLLWLCAELYFEGLVDRDLLVVWSIEFLNSCKPCAILAGLEFVKLFWIPATHNLRLSKWLVQVLVNQIKKVKSALPSETNGLENPKSSVDITALYSSITTSLTETLERLFNDCPDSFIIPWQWVDTFEVLVTCPDLARTIVSNPQFKSITLRNQEFAGPSGSSNTTTNQQYLYDSLDTLYQYVDPQQIVTQSLASGCSTHEILSLLFSMAVANDRFGIQHVDIAIAVSQYWGANEITSAIMTILADPQIHLIASVDKLCRLLNGLTLANSIHLNRYIRLLISRNILRSGNLQLVQLHTTLLSNINFGTENRLLFNQQKLLLASVGHYSEDSQNEYYHIAKHHLLQYLSVWVRDGQNDDKEKVIDDVDRAEVQSSLRRLVGTLAQKLINWTYNQCMRKIIKTSTDLSWITPDSLCLVLDVFKWTGNIQGSISIITALVTLKNNNSNLLSLIPSISMFIYTNLTSFSVFCNVQVLVTRIFELHRRSPGSSISSSNVLQLLVSSIFGPSRGLEPHQSYNQKYSGAEMQTPASMEGASAGGDSTKLGYVNQILEFGDAKPAFDVYFKTAIDKLVSAKDESVIGEMIKVFQILFDMNPVRIGHLLENWVCLQHDPAWSITHQDHAGNNDDQQQQQQQQQQQSSSSTPSNSTLLGSDSLDRDELFHILALLIAHNCWPIEKVVSAYLKIGQKTVASTPGVGGTSCDITFVFIELLCGSAAAANLSPSEDLSLLTQVDILRSNCPRLYLKFIFTCLDMLVSQQDDNNSQTKEEIGCYLEKLSFSLKWATSSCFDLLKMEIDRFDGGEYWNRALVGTLKKSIGCGEQLCDLARHINTGGARLIQLYVRLQVEFGMVNLDANLILDLVSSGVSADQLSNLFISLPPVNIVKLADCIFDIFIKSRNFPAVYESDFLQQGDGGQQSSNKRPLQQDTDEDKGNNDTTKNNNLVDYLVSIIQVCCCSLESDVHCPIPKELQDPKLSLESLVNMVRNIELLDGSNRRREQIVNNIKTSVILMAKFISFYYCLPAGDSSLDQRLRVYHGFVSPLLRTQLVKSNIHLRQIILDGSSCLLDLPIHMANPPKSLVDLAGISLALSGHEIPTTSAPAKDGAGTGTGKTTSAGARLTATTTSTGSSPSKMYSSSSTSPNSAGSSTTVTVSSCLAACLVNIQLPTTTVVPSKTAPQEEIMYKFYSETPMSGMMLCKRQQQQQQQQQQPPQQQQQTAKEATTTATTTTTTSTTTATATASLVDQRPSRPSSAAAGSLFNGAGVTAVTTPPRPRSAGPDLAKTESGGSSSNNNNNNNNPNDGNGVGQESISVGSQQQQQQQQQAVPVPPPITYTTPSLLNIKPVDLLEDFNIAPTCDNDVALSLSLFDAVKWV